MIIPRDTWVLVKSIPKQEVKLASGILIDSGWDVAPESIKAEVVAVGPNVTDIKAGDVVFVPQYAPTKVVELPSDKTYIVAEEDIVAVVVPDKAAK